MKKRVLSLVAALGVCAMLVAFAGCTDSGNTSTSDSGSSTSASDSSSSSDSSDAE